MLADLLARVSSSLPPHLTSWVPGVTPMSTWRAASTTILSYLAVIFALQEFMKNRPAFKLRTLFRCHNAFLSIASLILFLLIVEEAVWISHSVGLYNAFCARSSWTRRLEFYYMINYYFKYIEFLDTVLLLLRKRPLSFLHVFHHASTALLSFVQMEGRVSGSWTIISINLAVHVIMYYYYYATAGGAKIWWKKYLTTTQIIQFVIDLVLFYFGLYQHFAFTYWSWLPHIGDCAGDERTALFGLFLIASFLGLFANFYIQTYQKNGRDTEPTRNGRTNSDDSCYTWHSMTRGPLMTKQN